MSKVAAAFAALVLSACATTTRTTVDYLYVIAHPAGAQVTTSTGAGCVAPCTLILPRNADFDVTIKQAGYEPWSGKVTRVPKNANSKLGSAAGGVVRGTAVGVVAAGTSGEIGLAYGVPVLTNAGANIVLGSAVAGIGVHLVVDATTGANYDFAPNPLVVRLIPVAPQ